MVVILFTHAEKPTSLTSFDYNLSSQLQAYRGQTVMIAVHSFDDSSGAITQIVDNLQLRVTGAGVREYQRLQIPTVMAMKTS